MNPLVRRTWAAAGCTPILHTRTRSYRRVSAIGAITISPRRHRLGLLLRLHPGESIAQDQALAFLKDLLRHLRGHIILLWDRLPVHRGKRVQEFIADHPRLHVEWFPGYAPELNPVESIWSHSKRNRLANYCPDDVSELHDTAQTVFAEYKTDQSLLRSFIKHTGLPMLFGKRLYQYGAQ